MRFALALTVFLAALVYVALALRKALLAGRTGRGGSPRGKPKASGLED